MEELEFNEENNHAQQHIHHENCCSHDHSDEIQVYKMSTAAKFAACDHFRLEGLGFFQEAQWGRARARFQKILVYLDYTFPSSEEEEQKAAQLKQLALLNSAICALRLQEFRETISLASQVIREWKDCSRAYFCRGKAYRLLGEFKEARDDLGECVKLVPQSREAQKELLVVDSDERCYRVECGELARDMFNTASVRTPTKLNPTN